MPLVSKTEGDLERGLVPNCVSRRRHYPGVSRRAEFSKIVGDAGDELPILGAAATKLCLPEYLEIAGERKTKYK